MRKVNKNWVTMLSKYVDTAVLVGCDDIQKYTEKKNLASEHVGKIKRIILEHSKRQNELLGSMKNHHPIRRSAGGPRRIEHGR